MQQFAPEIDEHSSKWHRLLQETLLIVAWDLASNGKLRP